MLKPLHTVGILGKHKLPIMSIYSPSLYTVNKELRGAPVFEQGIRDGVGADGEQLFN